MHRSLSPVEIEDLLRTASHAHFGCALEGRVYVVPMAYGYDGSYVYVHTRPGKKLDVMRQNPSVCLSVDDVETPYRWRSVVVDGTVEFLEREEDREHAARTILGHQGLPQERTSVLFKRWGGEPDAAVLLRIHIRELSGRAENWPET